MSRKKAFRNKTRDRLNAEDIRQKPLGFSVGQLQDSAVRLTLPHPSKKRIRQQIIKNLFKSIFLRIMMLRKLLQKYKKISLRRRQNGKNSLSNI